MKKLSHLVTAAALLLTLHVDAQTSTNRGVPQAFPYSSQVRDANGNILANQTINLRISMRSGSPDGPIAYREVNPTVTSPNGIFSVVVGGGTIVEGNFDSIPWVAGQIYQQVELDERGGTNFVDMGTSQLLSLPYAIAAGNGVEDVKFDETGKLSVKSADGSETIQSDVSIWLATGNAGMGPNDFIGTTDDADLTFKRNSAESLRLRDEAVTIPNKLGLGGVVTPMTTLDVNGGMSFRETTINVTGNYTLNVGNRSLIFLNSSVMPYNAQINLVNGLVKGQIVMISVTGTQPYYGVKFTNSGSGTPNTRISLYGNGITSTSGSKNYTDGNTISFLWNGTDWVQISSSYTE